jgi:hypothetical protein
MNGQDPEKETKKQRKQREHNQVVDTITSSIRRVDSLYLEQRMLNMKLDSLIKEKSKK